MDALSGLLADTRAREAFVLRNQLVGTWCIRVQDRAPLTLVAVVSGRAWLARDQGQPTVLDVGDVVLVRGPEAYDVSSAPGTPATFIIGEDQRCTSPQGIALHESMSLGVRTWGNAEPGEHGDVELLVGTYARTSEIGARLLAALPGEVLLRADDTPVPAIDMLLAEAQREEPGQAVVLDRLLDLAVVSTLRRWLATAGDAAPGWKKAHADKTLGRVIELMHDHPDHAWSVAELAKVSGMSRAAFARRFTELVGTPPLSYLTDWRLTLAADLLTDPGRTLEQVAREVGYGSSFALSAAFKRARGISPSEHRRLRLAG